MHATRRDFLRTSALLALAPTVPGFLAQSARAARSERDGRVLVVVELNGGTLRLRDAESGGALFEITLPRAGT